MGVFFQRIMGASVLPVAIFTAIWGVVGVLLPVLVPRSPHKSVIQVTFKQGEHIFKLPAPGLPDHHRLLLLALLALLLHGSDESSYWWVRPLHIDSQVILSVPGPELELKARVAMLDHWGNLHGKE